jgi:protein-L-isoaspartate(D-aspartate) O-methyltransferase
MKILCLIFLFFLASCPMAGDQGLEAEQSARVRMVQEIRNDVERTSRRIGKKTLSPSVMQSMAQVPRHEFVPEHLRYAAYENRPPSIGYGQTISQPYIVALMTDLLDVDTEDTVLEVGTGSGYQAAVLANLVRYVYSIEIIEELANQAGRRLQKLGYRNVSVSIGDGYYGLEADAPYDAVIVTAAARHVPPPLIKQLKPGGKMVIPVGRPFVTQQLMVVEKGEHGKITTKQILPVIFVPLTGGH